LYVPACFVLSRFVSWITGIHFLKENALKHR